MEHRQKISGAMLATMLLVAGATAPAGAMPPPFGDPVMHALDVPGYTSVQAVNFRGTGRSDLLIGHAGRLSLYRSNADGSFAAPEDFGAGYWVYAFDLNGDGRTDILHKEVWDTLLTVQLCGTDGTLGPPSCYQVGEVLGFGDFDGDHHPDMLALMPDYSYAILFNDGTGHFGPAVPTGWATPAGNGSAIAAGDLDGDGMADLAIDGGDMPGARCIPDTLWLLKREPDGTFTTRFRVASTDDCRAYAPSQIFIADFNRDGSQDLVVLRRIDEGSGTYDSYSSMGDWNYGSQVSSHVDSESPVATLGDFNRDGAPDLVAYSNDAVTYIRVQFSMNNGDGTFDWTELDSRCTMAGSLTVGDFNGDGLPDVIVGFGGYRWEPDSSYGTTAGFLVYLNQSAPATVGKPKPPIRLALQRVEPNPTRGPITATLSLPSTLPARVLLLDVRGRKIVSRVLPSPSVGANVVRIDRASSLAPGIYWIRVDQGGASVSTKVALLE